MPRITQEMLRKRAEHNEGMLSNLEEIALHQQDIEKIENLDKLCRHIQILLLQNNIINKIENVSKLKEMQYLNLAVNNITKIENLEGCESLKKLDLTCNFIDLGDYEESLYNLKKAESIAELYLTGNPCQDFPGWRDLAVAIVDQLQTIDGKEVVPSERIVAKQRLPDLLLELKTQAEMKKIKEQNEPKDENAYTPESRTKMYLEIVEQREEEDRRKNPEKYVEKKESSTHYPNGDLRQCNEGKYDWKLEEYEDPEFVLFELKLPRFLDTSLIDVNVLPKLISVRVKGKLTQLKLSEEVFAEKAEIKRSQLTGALSIKIPKVNPNEILLKAKSKQKIQEEEKKQEEDKEKKRIQQQKELDEERKHQEKKAKKKNPEESEKKQVNVDYALDDIPDLE